MKKNLSKIIAIVTTALVVNSIAFAAPIEYEITDDLLNNKFTVTGNAQENEQIVFQILKKDKNFSDWTSLSDINDFILWQGQMTVGSSKAFSFDVPFLDTVPAGVYKSRIISNYRSEISEKDIPIVGTATMSTALSDMLTATSGSDYTTFKNSIDGGDAKVSPAGFDLSLYNKLGFSTGGSATGSDIVKMSAYFDFVKTSGSADFAPAKHLDSDAVNIRNGYFTSFMLIEAIKAGVTAFDLKEQLEKSALPVTESALWTDITSGLNKTFEWDCFKEKLIGQSASVVSLPSLKQAIIEALILTETKYADGDNVKNILAKYGADIGIASPTSINKVYADLSGQDYEDITAFKRAYSGLVANYNTSATNDSGKGSGVSVSKISGEVPQITQTTEPSITITVPFVDIEGITWAQESIIALAHKGILSGKENGYFDPDGLVTREQFAKILVCALNLSDETYAKNNFSDVNSSDWFYSYVNIAYEKGLVNGIGSGRFGTGNNISRQDMVVMLCNALKYKGMSFENSETEFEDNDEIAAYARSAVNAMNKMGVVSGMTSGHFQPMGNATRAQAAKVVYGILSLLEK